MMMFKTKSSQLTIVIFVFLVTTSFIFKSTIKLPEAVGAELESVQVNSITNNFISDSIGIITEEFNQEELIQLLKDLNVKYPHIVLAQSILETGHYKSKVFKENHNLFGMKEARVRIHTAKGTKNGHAYYENWKESVYDYAFYQSTYYSDVKSENQYYRKLDRSYAEAKNYINSVKEIVERENLTQKFLDK